MLSNIVSGKLPSSFVLIQDSVEQNGHQILCSFTQEAIYTKQDVHILCLETPVSIFQSSLNDVDNSSVQFYDCFSDHRDWIKKYNLKSSQHDNMQLNNFNLSHILKNASHSNNCIVIIDSLSSMVYNVGVPETYRQLHTLINGTINNLGLSTSQVVCLLHEDVIPNRKKTLAVFLHLATTCLQVEPPTQSSAGCPTVNMSHRKGSKVIRKIEQYHIDSRNHLTSEEISATPVLTIQDPGEHALPESLTTFKLGLGNQEKEARSRLVLPYLRVDDGAAVGSGGQVFYQPDAADDWDEEDPDDDLDV